MILKSAIHIISVTLDPGEIIVSLVSDLILSLGTFCLVLSTGILFFIS